jgi:hypothetical protein
LGFDLGGNGAGIDIISRHKNGLWRVSKEKTRYIQNKAVERLLPMKTVEVVVNGSMQDTT